MVVRRETSVDPSRCDQPIPDPQALGEVDQPGQGRAVAHQEQAQVWPAGSQLGHCPHQSVQALVGDDGAHRSHIAQLGVQTETAPGLLPGGRLLQEHTAHSVGAQHDVLRIDPLADQVLLHGSPQGDHGIGRPRRLRLALGEQQVAIGLEGIRAARRGPGVGQLSSDLIHPGDAHGLGHRLHDQRVGEVRGGVQHRRAHVADQLQEQLGLLLQARVVSGRESRRQESVILDAVHGVHGCRPQGSGLDRPPQAGDRSDVPAGVPQCREDGMRALGIPGSGVRKGVVEHVERGTGPRAVPLHGRQPGTVAREGRQLRAQPVPLAPLSARAGQAVDGLVHPSGVPVQACQGCRTSSGPRVDLIQQSCRRLHVPDAGQDIGVVDQAPIRLTSLSSPLRPRRELFVTTRRGQPDGPGDLQGSPVETCHELGQRSAHRGRQPTGDLQCQKRRIVAQVLRDGGGRQRQIRRPLAGQGLLRRGRRDRPMLGDHGLGDLHESVSQGREVCVLHCPGPSSSAGVGGLRVRSQPSPELRELLRVSRSDISGPGPAQQFGGFPHDDAGDVPPDRQDLVGLGRDGPVEALPVRSQRHDTGVRPVIVLLHLLGHHRIEHLHR